MFPVLSPYLAPGTGNHFAAAVPGPELNHRFFFFSGAAAPPHNRTSPHGGHKLARANAPDGIRCISELCWKMTLRDVAKCCCFSVLTCLLLQSRDLFPLGSVSEVFLKD